MGHFKGCFQRDSLRKVERDGEEKGEMGGLEGIDSLLLFHCPICTKPNNSWGPAKGNTHCILYHPRHEIS